MVIVGVDAAPGRSSPPGVVTSPLDREGLLATFASIGDLTAVLADADPHDKAELYTEIGIRLMYDPIKRVVITEHEVVGVQLGVGGGT